MPTKTARFKPGHEVSFTASAAITGGQLVEVTGARTVAPAAAASSKAIGYAQRDAASGASVPIFLVGGGVVLATASGAVAAGDQIVTAAAGAAATSATPATGTRIGIALTAAASGADFELLLSPA